MFSPPCAVIFDCDGVLVDSEPFNLLAWQILLQEKYNIYVPTEQLKKFLGYPAKDTAKHLAEEFGFPFSPTLGQEKDDVYFRVAQEKIQPMPYIVDVLQFLQTHNIPYIVASSARPEKIEFSLREAKLLQFFPTRVSSVDVLQGKPQPDIFLKAASILNVSPETCWVIEDSVAGLTAAYNARMTALAYGSALTQEESYAAGATWYYTDHRMLKEKLAQTLLQTPKV